METVESYEEKGRRLFINNVIPALEKLGYIITNIIETKIEERWDLEYNQEKDGVYKKIFAEIKYRNIKSDDYEDTMLDQSKFDYLRDKHKNEIKIQKTEIVFCSIFNDHKSLFWNIIKDEDKVRYENVYTSKMTVGLNTKKRLHPKVFFNNSTAWKCDWK